MVPAQITQSSVCAPTKITFSFFFPCDSGRSSGGEGTGADLFAPFSWGRAEATIAPAKPNPLPSTILREIFPIDRRLTPSGTPIAGGFNSLFSAKRPRLPSRPVSQFREYERGHVT